MLLATARRNVTRVLLLQPPAALFAYPKQALIDTAFPPPAGAPRAIKAPPRSSPFAKRKQAGRENDCRECQAAK